jgi:hypothetical protein
VSRRSELTRRFLVVAAVFALLAVALYPALAQEELKPVTDPAVNSPKEKLRQKIFAPAAGTPACVIVKSDPRGGTGLDDELDAFVKLVIKDIKTKNDTALQPLFHKRLKVGLPAVAEALAKLDITYGKPFDVSVYRMWAFNTVDGTPSGLPCAEDGLTAYPHYGYPLQFGLWLQVMGEREIGRIYATIVPADGRWNLGSFHVQQWTHAGKDYMAWVEDALKTAHAGHKEAAFIKYDIAAKLLDAGKSLELAVAADADKARDAVMTREAWDKSIRDTLKGYDVAYTSTLLVVDGAGTLVRLKTPGEISVEDIKSSCQKIAETILTRPWAADTAGMRCSYVLPREDPAKEGILGGIYLSFADVRAAQAKAQAKGK